MKHKHDHGANLLNMDNLAQHSPLAHVDGRVKILFAVAMLLLCIAMDSLVSSLFIACSMIGLMVGLCKLRLGQILGLMKIPIGFILISCITIAVQVSSQAEAGGISLFGLSFYLTKDSALNAFLLFCKAYGAVTCLYFLNVSTTVQSMIFVCNQWHFPKILVELMYLIYRYLFVLLDVQRNMVVAAKSRLGDVRYKSRWYTFCRIGGNMLIQSFQRSSACFDAMESRLYDGTIGFYTQAVPLVKRHWVYAGSYVGLTILVGIFGRFL